MANTFSMLGIMNAALTAQGVEKLSSPYDGSPEALALLENWPLIIEAELEDGHYNFTRSEERLLTRIDGKFGFSDGYRIPSAGLHVRHVWTLNDSGGRCFPDWSSDDSYVYLDAADGCYAEVLISQDPALWGANFAAGVRAKLEAVLLRMDDESGTAMEQMAEASFQRARTVSSKARKRDDLHRESRIAAARFRRG
ncbi:hypothetical protein KM176_16480 [Pseudooceanicola sp. CBS1P-1]|uniref:Uncharacterized protein n=1 Tax=Pseudooceanicola albus TaxID=2692189 RepID=A0A6L7G6U1_9RHOB|nr:MULTISPECIES: hypothetical protein [Pseudooceanicola]MBT9385472.1 hypothetical protein [Pseudooceanicola endophyticus]MXN19116.1 hypothetical protein [Pseudooceanicola albus]